MASRPPGIQVVYARLGVTHRFLRDTGASWLAPFVLVTALVAHVSRFVKDAVAGAFLALILPQVCLVISAALSLISAAAFLVDGPAPTVLPVASPI